MSSLLVKMKFVGHALLAQRYGVEVRVSLRDVSTRRATHGMRRLSHVLIGERVTKNLRNHAP
jgi:hypothetical protein